MEKELNYKEIEDYVNDKLEEEAKKAFETRLSKDTALAEEVAFYQDLATTSEMIGDEALKKSIGEIDKELFQEGFFSEAEKSVDAPVKPIQKTSPNSQAIIRSLNMRRIISLAASLLLITTFGITWWANANYSNESLAIGNFDNEAIQLINRSGSEQMTDIFGPGLAALNADNNTEAIRFFENIPASAEYYTEARLYLGIACFRNQEFQNALDNAEIVIQRSERFREKALWLKINTLLITGETGEEFKNLVNDMVQNSPDTYYQNEAKQLKNELDQFWRKFVF
jgi:hypothetical protein